MRKQVAQAGMLAIIAAAPSVADDGAATAVSASRLVDHYGPWLLGLLPLGAAALLHLLGSKRPARRRGSRRGL